MTVQQTKQIINQLQHKGVLFDDGLSDLEVKQVKEKFDVQFPPDLKRLLQTWLPVSDSFINWRRGLTDRDIADGIWHMLNLPLNDILRIVANGSFWVEPWGTEIC